MIHDFAVIGAGMAGASIAAELAPHASVLVLEGEEAPGYHATGRSAAFWEECYGGPGVVPLTLASGTYLGEHGFLTPRGALYVGRAEDRAAMDAHVATFAATGVTLKRLAPDALADKVPHIRPEWSEALHQPACADIDVAGLHQHYLGAARRHGVTIACRARITRIVRESGAWTITSERGETWRAAMLVNAAGAWVDQIAGLAGVRPIGINPFRRTVAVLRVAPHAPADLPLVLDINGGFYFKPDAGRLWLSPHDEIPSAPCDAAPEEIDVAVAIDRFMAVTDWRIEAVERRWAGLRSFAPDRLPVYGADPEAESFFWFAGQGGFGIQTAPAAARLGAQLLLGQGRDAMTARIDPAMFTPLRFQSANQAQSA
ncbi:NAD(P)/FAD-dependent oxidoreductase [Porphyrobacter sp. AAP60]|uniref:NAD(P)/FAD-dependent oxidoreductase n=1 Tax=Porphyrobacter sp. AAP60 TaxID=1523423 RepID=UPI0006B91780|nr:FAD-dependent oxidoreductase [Porphyrobacter sp. AAP60]KPF61966.1 FAD-dependent oxidoreductase [Porphyrobacter sp. AAP60]